MPAHIPSEELTSPNSGKKNNVCLAKPLKSADNLAPSPHRCWTMAKTIQIHINHIAGQVEHVLWQRDPPFLNFIWLPSVISYFGSKSTSYFLINSHFVCWEPRYHSRESQDLSTYEWEEMSGERTTMPVIQSQHVSLLLCAQVKNQRLFSLHGSDLVPRFSRWRFKSTHWKVFGSRPSPSPAKTGPDLAPAPAPGLLGQLLRWSGLSAGSVIHFLSQHHEVELQLQCSDDPQTDFYIWIIIQFYV